MMDWHPIQGGVAIFLKSLHATETGSYADFTPLIAIHHEMYSPLCNSLYELCMTFPVTIKTTGVVKWAFGI